MCVYAEIYNKKYRLEEVSGTHLELIGFPILVVKLILSDAEGPVLHLSHCNGLHQAEGLLPHLLLL